MLRPERRADSRKYEKSPDGWEETSQVNALSTAMLELLLLP